MRHVIVNSFGKNADLVNYLHTALSLVWPAEVVVAASVPDAVDMVLARRPRPGEVRTLQFWGHGWPGGMCVGDEALTAESFGPGHPHRANLERRQLEAPRRQGAQRRQRRTSRDGAHQPTP